jgi:four helix bundle protein
MDFVIEIYKSTQTLPKEETYGLLSQGRRAVVSIPSNIAEGQGRSNDKEFAHFLKIAHGSLREVETQLLICERLCYVMSDVVKSLLDHSAEVGRLINGLLNRISEPN